jgi:hypothetical protein
LILELQRELLAMREADLRVRDELAQAGGLDSGYHPRMELVHRQNAERLRAIVGEHGWPGTALVGADGAEAAWLVVQHSIGEPGMQREYLPLLLEAATRGEIPRWQPAYLADRICFFEGRPQLYGTHSDWNDEGLMAIYPLDAPERVNELRAGVGLPPLDPSKMISDQRIPPEKLAHHREQMNAWAKSVGWRK